MKDWEQKLDEFLKFNERNVLPDAGKISKQDADTHAKTEYDRFEKRRREYKELAGQDDNIRQLEAAAKEIKDKEVQ